MPTSGLRILILGPYTPDTRVTGGVAAATIALADALSRHEGVAHVTVAGLVRRKEYVGRLVINDRLEARSVVVPFISGDTIIQSVQCLPAFRRLIADIRPDVVHGQGIDRNGDIAVQLGLPAVVTVHGLVQVEARLHARGLGGRIRVMVYDRMVRRVLRRAKVVISISDYDTRILGNLVAGKRVSIPNAIQPDFFEPHDLCAERPTVLFAGVMAPRKNVVGLVNAFAKVAQQVPAAQMVIAGPSHDIQYAEQVRSRVTALGLNHAVRFLGHVSNEQLVDAMRRSSVMALFSYEETLPTVLAQAMAVRRPVVASAVGGVPELVSDGERGFVVPPGDETALAERLVQLLSSPALADEMGRRGHDFARQRFTSHAVAEQTLQAYYAAIKAAQQARGAPISA